jgi:amidase
MKGANMNIRSDLIAMRAVDVIALLHNKEVTPTELVSASLQRIRTTDPLVNALPTLCEERAYAQAAALEASLKKGAEMPLLGGLPIAVKDLDNVGGVRTTQGSPIYADDIAEKSDLHVARLEQNGAIPVGKSNTPEFGAGANTFNEVFGPTLNPWNTQKTAGGSSGGSAVALATGQVWLATGSDMGGSVRTPAAYCSVVGLRPCPGRIARQSSVAPFGTLSVKGPMGRCVEDTALMLDAMVGQSTADPLSQPPPAQAFLTQCRQPTGALRVAWSEDLNIVPVAREVREICSNAVKNAFGGLNWEVDEAHPDFSDSHFIFQTERALEFVKSLRVEYDTQRDRLKPEIIWNIERGLALTAENIADAGRARGRLVNGCATFFERYDILATPTSVAPPFDVTERYLTRVEDEEFSTYIDWLAPVYALTCAALPVISVPAGFTADGLPVGLQLVGPPHGEALVLAAARQFEACLGLQPSTPILPGEGHISRQG